MLTVLIVIHLIIVMAMIGVVLLQRSEGGGLGIAQSGGFLSSRGTANTLTRTTAILATFFFLTSLTLSVLAGMNRREKSILQNTGAQPTEQAPAGAPPAPLGGPNGGGVLNELQKREQQAPPAAPSGPQVPRSQ